MVTHASTIPKGWKETTLGDVAIFHYGEGLKTENRESGQIPVYGSSGITGFHNQALVNEPGYIIGRKGTVGSVYFSPTPFFPIDTVYYVTKSDIKCDFEYFFYLLKTLRLESLNFDSAVPGLSRAMAYSLKIKTPVSEAEQKAIAAVLSSLDNKIELLREQNKTLETTAQSTFKEWFVKPSLGKELPKGWKIGKLGDIADITTGKGIDKSALKSNGLYQVLGANGEIGKTDEFLFDDDLILAGRVGTLGKVYLSKGRVWISDNVLISKPKSKEDYYFIYFQIKRINFDSLNRGSTQPLVTQTDLKNVEIILPERKILEKWHVVVFPLFEKILKNNSQIQTLSKIRDTILPKLMKGQMRVKY